MSYRQALGFIRFYMCLRHLELKQFPYPAAFWIIYANKESKINLLHTLIFSVTGA